MGRFFGFKLHLIFNYQGELPSFYLTKSNVDDRNIDVVTAMTKEVFGKLFGDREYTSKALTELSFQDGIQLMTKVGKNMKKQNLSDVDAMLPRKRALVGSVDLCVYRNISIGSKSEATFF